MKAILCRTLPATNTKGTRVKALTDYASVTISADQFDRRSDADNEAVRLLCTKHGWNDCEFVIGTLPNGERCYVFADSKAFDRLTIPAKEVAK